MNAYNNKMNKSAINHFFFELEFELVRIDGYFTSAGNSWKLAFQTAIVWKKIHFHLIQLILIK